MSQRRRGGGFRGPELRGTLGTLLRSTLDQASLVKDALERGAREGRSRLDEARANRRRADALASLGETVLELIRNGEIDLDELPEVRSLVRDLDELDGFDDGSASLREVAHAPNRSRFDTRDAPAAGTRAARTARDDDDDTVSSSRWAPLRSAVAEAGAAAARVWRPPTRPSADADPAPAAATPAPSSEATTARLRPDPRRKGGIMFDDDSDLADYMHPDDVPARDPSAGPDSEPNGDA